MSPLQLTQNERDFLETINDVVCSNPFSASREEAERMMAPHSHLPQPDPKDPSHVFNDLSQPLKTLIKQLADRGIKGLNQVAGNDRKLLEVALIHKIYLRYLDPMDELLEKQLRVKSKAVKVDFAPQLLADLHAFGFTGEEAQIVLGVVYQIRRAFYFIATALVGDCPSMRQLRCDLWNNIFTFDIRNYRDYLWDRMEDFSTLILGDTGTGKGSAARAIGSSGLMRYNPSTQSFEYGLDPFYLQINLSEYPESLIESALFGHTKGAFTGAVSNFEGLFKRCIPHGTLFLDEIGDVSQPVQVKLLNVLQERRFTPVGSTKQLRFPGRVICATSKPLEKIRSDGVMRQDLFYRLSSDIIHMPTLKQRLDENPDELRQLVHHLCTRMMANEEDNLSDWIVDRLDSTLPKNYSWPGNVRELEQAIRRVLLKHRYEGIQMVQDNNANNVFDQELDHKTLLAQYCANLYEKHKTYEKVARITDLDRRTVKKYIEHHDSLQKS